MIRIGMLAGTGTGRKRILPAVRDSPVCRVTVLQGRDPGRLAEVARTDPAVHLVRDVEEFTAAADRFDVVYLGGPPFLRVTHLEAAVRLGRPVLCEKPLTTGRDQLAAITALLTGDAPRVAVAHHLRHTPAARRVRELLREGAVGEIRDVHLQWDFPMDLTAPNAAWKLRADLAGSSCMFDSGVHLADLALWLFGVPAAVCATGQGRRTAGVHDSVTAILDYRTFTVTIVTSQAAATGANDLVITGSDGVLRAPGLCGERSIGEIVLRGDRISCATPSPYRLMVEDFCLGRAGSTPADAIATSEILFAVEESIAGGRTVPVSRAPQRR